MFGLHDHLRPVESRGKEPKSGIVPETDVTEIAGDIFSGVAIDEALISRNRDEGLTWREPAVHSRLSVRVFIIEIIINEYLISLALVSSPRSFLSFCHG